MCKLRILREINSGKFESSITAILITCFSFLILQILLHLCDFIWKIQSHKTCQKCPKIWKFYVKLYLVHLFGSKYCPIQHYFLPNNLYLRFCRRRRRCVLLNSVRLQNFGHFSEAVEAAQCGNYKNLLSLSLSNFAQKFREINAFSTKSHYTFFFSNKSKIPVFPHCGQQPRASRFTNLDFE